MDKLSGRKLYLRELVLAGPNAWAQAEKIREELVRQVEQRRHPRTDATVAQMLEQYLTEWEGRTAFAKR